MEFLRRAKSLNKRHDAYPVQPSKASVTLTETPGEFCKHAPSYKKKLTFVTLEDIFGGQFEMNMVLYNPRLSKEQNERILKHVHMHVFRHHPITDDIVDELTSYDEDHLDEFMEAYKKLIMGT